MPLYFIDVITRVRVCRDPEGVDLSDDGAARQYAEEDARDLLRHIKPGDWEHTRLVLKDEGGKELAAVSLRENSEREHHWARRGGQPAGPGNSTPM